MKDLYAQVEDHIAEYDNGTIPLSEDIPFSMRKTVRQITHYILSRYMDGGADNLDPVSKQRRPFRNIGNFIVDLETRAKNIDRKSVDATSLDGDYVFSLQIKKELQHWMKVNGFGRTIDKYQRKKSEYGSVLLKKTETADQLIIEPVNWSTMKVDPRDIANGMKIDTNFLTPLELKMKRGFWDEQHEGEDAIDAVLAAAKKTFRSEKGEKRIEVLDVEGQFEARTVYPEDYAEDDEAGDEIGLYNVIIAVVKNKKYTLYRTKLTESRYKHDKRKSVEDRDFGVGVWEEVFEPQIWTNEAVIDEREALNIAGKVVVKTNKKGIPSALSLMQGEVIDLEANEFFDAVQLRPNALPEFQRVINSWFTNTQRDQSAYPGVTGEEPKASTPGISLELQAAQGGSIFNQRRDQDAFFLQEVITDWVIPFLIKKIEKEHVLTASYSKKELELIDRAYREHISNNEARERTLNFDLSRLGMGELFTNDDKMAVEAQVQEQLNRDGDKRKVKVPKGYFTLKRVEEKVRFDITDEMSGSQRRMNVLAAALSNMAPDDPGRADILAELMELGGVSPASFPLSGGSSGAPASSPRPTSASRVQEVLPAGQQ